MSDKKRWIRLAVAAGLGAAAGAWTYQIQKDKKAKNDARLAVVEAAVVRSRDYGKQKAYIIGNSLSSLAAAVWLIKDCHFPGSSIMVYGENEEACGNAGLLVVSRENAKIFWNVWKTARFRGKSVYVSKNRRWRTSGMCRPSGTLAAVMYRRGKTGCFKC